MSSNHADPARAIALVGMAGRFPGADDLAAFWRNLRDGVESIVRFSRRELEEEGIDPLWLDDPSYVPASGALEGIDLFDADFFSISGRDAELMDPQHRLFLECCWQALEHAGHDAATFDGAIGLFGGCGASDYLFNNLQGHRDLLATVGPLQLRVFNNPDYLTSIVAYKLGLTGPCVAVQSACSTALVAVSLACQSLLARQCDAALAGGVSLSVPAKSGYLSTAAVLSPDGHCRAFDAASQGTVVGSGGGVVVLRRLDDALADGDHVLAVIRGFANNNDGAFKSSFAAPSVDGQMEAIVIAQTMAGIEPETITYVEAHGTGTPLGDPIEVAALTEAFASDRRGFCALGSVKTNIGHLDAAAGVAGLIKTVLALEHAHLPPSLHFETPNPQIDFDASPFYVVDAGRPWQPPAGVPRRAGVSSFGLGGSNAHLVLEEAPSAPPSSADPPRLLLTLSAATASALERRTADLLEHLESHPDQSLADVAFTLQSGRRMLPFRRALVCSDRDDAIAALRQRDPRRLHDGSGAAAERTLAFLFPGLGHHYPGMARDLYPLPGFREPIDLCAEILEPHLGCDLRRLLFESADGDEVSGDTGSGDDAGLDLRRLLGRGGEAVGPSPLASTRLSQPAVFALEYALAGLLVELGLRPEAMLGYSIGEYVAACLAGVFSLEDALALVAERARLIAELPPGAMLAVPLGEGEIERFLSDEVALAAQNGPELSVLAGPQDAIAEIVARLEAEQIAHRRLDTEHAFHSPMMEPIAAALRSRLATIELLPPQIPYLSNVSGDWIGDEEATDPEYWLEHLLRPVRFGDAVGELWRDGGRALLEVGPGQTLCSWALQHPEAAAHPTPLALPTLRHDFDRQHDLGFLLATLERLWLAGQPIDWRGLWRGQRRRRVALPGYPFERRRYWIEPPKNSRHAPPLSAVPAEPIAELAEVAAAPPAPAAESRRAASAAHPRPALAVPHVAPRNTAEERLAALFADVLHLDEVGILDSFFDLGGDSLQATTLVGRLRAICEQEITLPMIFEYPTVVDLVKFLQPSAPEPAADVAIPKLVPHPGPSEGRDWPLTFAQRRLWFLAELAPEHPGYNHPLVFEAGGRLEIAALEACLSEIVRRHEILRTAFVRPDEAIEPVQRVAPAAVVVLPIVDLTALEPPRRDAERQRQIRRQARFRFDLARPGLVRPWLFVDDLGGSGKAAVPRRATVLLLLHHIVADGWSMGLLAREIEALYRAAVERRPSPLPELPVQVVDVARWQRHAVAETVFDDQLHYWRQQLDGLPTLELPHDRPRTTALSKRGLRLPFSLGRAATQRLVDLARRHDTTAFVALLAAFEIWLYRISGESDLAVGSPVAGRNHPLTESLIGFFVNTLVLRNRLEPDQTLHRLIDDVRRTTLDAQAHQDLPFERLVEELQPQRDLSRTPFFQVMLAWQSQPEARLDLPGVTLEARPWWQEAALFDLTLSPVLEHDGRLHGYFEVDRQLFDPTTAERMRRQLTRLLEAAATEPDRPLAALSLLDPAAEHQLRIEAQEGAAAPLRCADLAPRLILDQARHSADRVAVSRWRERGAEHLSYRQLEIRSRRWSALLRAAGARPDRRVALCVERSLVQIETLLAVWRAGACAMPLDPAYPQQRLSWMLDDAAVSVLVATPSSRALLGSLPAALRTIEVEPPGPAASGEEIGADLDPDLDLEPDLDHLAYVLYTSGSTGRPKGVAVSHRVLANLMRWQLGEALPQSRRTLQLAALGFDVSFQEIVSTLGGGGSLSLLDEDTRRDPAALWRLLRLERVERLFLPFVALQQLAETAPAETAGLALVEAITAGEKLRASNAIRSLFARLGARLDNHYGPTETHAATAFRLPARPERWDEAPAIGRAIDGAAALLLDPRLEPVPLGVVGELFLGGEALARGYLGRAAGTAARFLPRPRAPRPGSRLYRTGDLARWLADGQLHFLGRADHQVKVRGFRVEPAEVEAVLLGLPRVKSAAVVARGEGGGARLVAFLEGSDLEAAELRPLLAARLPEHLIPTQVVHLDALPLLPSGKVDRRALRQRPLPRSTATPAAQSDDARLIGEQIADLLEIDHVEPDDDFFTLGGHSLLATRLVSRLRDLFGVELPVRTIFETPTPAGLARQLERRGSERPAVVDPLPAAPRPPALPLSYAQERLWFLEQLEPGSPVYNMPMVLHLRGEVDLGLLETVLVILGRRHETLRTTFGVARSGRPVQVIADQRPIPLRHVDLSALGARAEEGARRLAEDEALLPFDLATGPLWRAMILRLDAAEHVLLLTLHHIISDGWSLGILAREVATLYAALRDDPEQAGRALEPLPLQYADYALWQRRLLAGKVLDDQLAYWRGELADERPGGAPTLPPVLELPADRPRGAARSWRGSSVQVHLPAEVTGRLRQLGAEHGSTLFMLLLAGYRGWLHRVTGERDLVVGTPIAGRQHREFEGLIGFFVNTLALRSAVSPAMSFSQLFARERERALAAYAHQDLPFEKLVEALQPSRELGQTPLFQVMLVLQNAPIPSLALPGLELRPFETGGGSAKFDLSLSLDEGSMTGGDDGGLDGWLVYSSDLFDRSTARRFADQYLGLLEHAARQPHLPLAALEVLRPAERHQLLREWNDRPAPAGGALEDLLDGDGHRDRLAVASDADALSYRELEVRARRLACRLRAAGAGPEIAVAIALEPGLELAIALRGAVEAGACCVPLDPSYPEARLAFMLEDSGAGLILSDDSSAALASTSLRRVPIDGPAPEAPPTARVDPRHPLYVIYTSGSTGRPKGVVLPRRAFADLLLWHRDSRLNGVRTAHFAPLSFDASFHEIFATWTTGGTLYPIAPPLRRDVEALARQLARWRLEKITLPGLVLHQLAALGAADGAEAGLSLREVITSGEQLRLTPTLRAWLHDLGRRLAGGVRFHNQYGPSESHMVSAHRVGAGDGTLPPVGRAIPSARLQVVDAGLRPVPIGAIGELLIGGSCLARGYLRRPALTAERFVPDPLARESGERLYRSGDLMRRLADGRLEFVGRRDQQVKLHGVRIELGEIEARLDADPAVERSAVTLRAGGPLVAYAVARRPPLDARALLQSLAAQLPRAMVPSRIVELDALPLLPNGKVDHRALPVGVEERAKEPPRGAVEEALAALWRELLEVETVHRDDDFFALGGHSLLATRLMTRIERAFGVGLPVRTLFEHGALAAIARRVESHLQQEAPPPIARENDPRPSVDQDPPASFAQQRLWFLDSLMPQNPFYNFATAVELRGELQVEALRLAMRELVRRHQSLRTTFAPPGGDERVPRQIIAGIEDVETRVPLIDLAGLPDEVADRELAALARQESRRPFDLARGPLLRAYLPRTRPDRHTLIFIKHHIITDGWSMGVMYRDLARLYAAIAGGRPPALPPLEVQYADYAAWQRRWLSEEGRSSQLAYWRRQLDALPGTLELPLDRPRPAVPSFRGRSLDFRVDVTLKGRLQQLAKEAVATPAMVLLSVFEVLLGRLSSQRDLAVGMAIANRRRLEFEPLIGLFVNTLVIRARLAGSDDLRRLLAQTRETCLGAYAHQDLPFEHLVEELEPERDLSRNPLVQAMFAYQNYPRPAIALPGLELLPPPQEGIDPGTSKFDLTLLFVEDGDELRGAFEVDAELFETTTLRRLQKAFATLLEGAVAEPHRPLADLDWLSAAERHQLLAAWNAERDRAAGDRASLDEIFLARAAELPDALALVEERDGSVQLSRGAVADRVRRLARRLGARGVGPESRVALCFERSAELILAILAVWRAGGAYLPLDPTLPPERLAFMVDDSGASSLLTEERCRATVSKIAVSNADLAVEPLVLDAAALAPGADEEAGAGRDEPPRRQGDRLAYVIYTSGSTGRPKGVECGHRGLLNLLLDYDSRRRLGAEDAVSFWGSPSFDVSLYEIGSSLLSGAVLHLVPAERRGEGPAFVDWLAARRITSAYLPAFLLADLERRLTASEVPAAARPLALRLLLAGAEPIPEARLVAIGRALPHLLALNAYGPTEATVSCTVHPVDRRSTGRGYAPLGRPQQGVAVHLLGPTLTLQPIGVHGEIAIGGAGLARGYLRRPALTAERFVPDPFGGCGERLYRTGDRARRLADGEIEFLGRFDHQVKVHGLRIELGEIEARLVAHPAIQSALAMVAGADSGSPRLVAFAVATDPASGERPELAELRAFLTVRLPRAMVPAEIFWLDAWPLNASGKIDRRRLAERIDEAGGGATSAPPATAAERALAEIWAEVLRREVGDLHAGDDFFSLGGHSLLAAQVTARIRERWGVELPLRTLFEQPTLEQLAATLERLEESGPAAARVLPQPRPQDGRRAVFPLSFAQERLWFIDQLQPWSTAYNLPLAVRLVGRLDQPALERAFCALAARHETLRTTFARLAGDTEPGGEAWFGEIGRGTPVQRIAPPRATPLPCVDLRALDPADRRHLSARLAEAEARRPFDLERGPLLRLTLLRTGEDEAVLLMTLHHIVGDAWSMRVLIEEIGAFYRGDDTIAPLPFQYADYAVWQRRWLDQRLDDELTFWRRELAGLDEALQLPTDRPRPALRSGRGSSLGFTLELDLGERLENVARERGATLFMVLLAAVQVLLRRHGRQRDFTVGTPIAGRRLAHSEELIGFFVNTLVLRSEASIGDSDPFAGLLSRVRERALDAFAHQDLPFERLVEALKPRRDPGQTPLFNVLFALQNVPFEPLDLEALRLEPLATESGVTRFDLGWSFTVTERGLEGQATYSRDLFDATTIHRLQRRFELLLRAIAADPEAPLAALPRFAAAERHQITHEWNDTGDARPPAVLHRLVEASARRFGDRVALAADASAFAGSPSRALSYRQLDRRADRLAAGLRRRGVGPDVVVAILARPGLELIVGALAILKAGGVYFPLEASAPPRRLAFLLADALGERRPAVLLGDRDIGDRIAAWSELAAETEGGGGGETPWPELETLRLDAEDSGAAAPPAEPVFPDHLAYLIYTSGSTGRPKGVMSTHRGIVNRLRIVDTVSPEDRFLQRSSPSFDASVREMFWPLIHGATLCLALEATRRDPTRLVELMQRERITVAGFVPTLLAATVREPRFRGCLALRLLISGGEVLPGELARQVLTALPAVALHNRYGPTEAATLVTGHRVAAPRSRRPEVPIGRPHPNSEVHFMSRGLEPVPIGVIGELCIGGEQLARGYLDRPALTARAFVPHPAARRGQRLYRSGDLGRFTAGGTIEFRGRRDHQIKVRGFRVEPGEIEAALERHPAIAGAVVTTDRDDRRRLVAYLTAGGDGLEIAELRRFLAAQLPEYMVPSVFVELERLPLLPSGKVDRLALDQGRVAALRRAVADRDRTHLEVEAPRSELERTIAAIWQQALGVERVGLHDGFFDLGGHSLLLVEVRARLQEELGRSFQLSDLFNHATVADLARFIAGTVDGDAAETAKAAQDLALSQVEERQQKLGAGKARRRQRLARRRSLVGTGEDS